MVYSYFKNIFSPAHSLLLFIFRKDAGCCRLVSAGQESPADICQTHRHLTSKYLALLKT